MRYRFIHVVPAILAGACSARTHDAPMPAPSAPTTTFAAPTDSANAVASDAGGPPPEPDLLHPERLDAPPEGLWTISYPAFPRLAFYQIATSPKGGFVVAGIEEGAVERHIILRLAEDGTPRWAAHVSMGFTLLYDRDLAVDEEGNIALLARHTGALTVNGRLLVPGIEDTGVVSLLILNDAGEVRGQVSHERKYTSTSKKVVALGGFVTTAFELAAPYADNDQGLIITQSDGRVLRRERLGFTPRMLATGRDLAVLGEARAVVKHRERVILPSAPPFSKGFLVATFDREGVLRWAHRFSDPYVYEATALAEDERGHVFAAFRYGESHGYADDPFAALVYELDDHGREAHRYTYTPDASLTRLFPGANGMAALGWFRSNEPMFRGKTLGLPSLHPSGDLYPVLFLRMAPDGRPLAIADLWTDHSDTTATPTQITTIANATAAGEGFLAAVGCVSARMTFAGIHVAEGEQSRCYIARVRRP